MPLEIALLYDDIRDTIVLINDAFKRLYEPVRRN
jgi:hypothetical protein